MVGTIPEELSFLPSLEYLYLRSNSFTNPIPSAIFNISTLKEIDLGKNGFSGSMPLDIMCAHSPSLQLIGLYNNIFTGTIHGGIANCTSLRELYLSGNDLTGMIISIFS